MTLTEFRRVFKEMYPSMSLYAKRIMGNDDVDDIIQDAFVELWNRHETIKDAPHLRHFLYRTVYTRCLSVLNHRKVVHRYRKDKTETAAESGTLQEPGHNDVLHNIETIELGHDLHSAINDLPEACRKVFVMSYVDNIDDKDIAHSLGISLRTVEAHIYKALKKLRSKLSNKR